MIRTELQVLEALAAPDTRWHCVTDLARATGLSESLVLAGLALLRGRGLATEQPPAWSITTQGECALAAHNARPGVEAQL